jgi:hypothetical protein
LIGATQKGLEGRSSKKYGIILKMEKGRKKQEQLHLHTPLTESKDE